jgi:uncharacterized protein (DUF2141 family)
MKNKILKIINAAWFPGILIMFALIIFALLVFFPSSSASTTVNTGRGTLTVTVTGLRNNKGNAIVCLYKAGPLSDIKNIADVREISISVDKVTAVFADIPFREYAIFVLHDENKNRLPDKSADGVSLEGMGFSNIKTVLPDVPDFQKVKFNFNRISQELHVPVLYW